MRGAPRLFGGPTPPDRVRFAPLAMNFRQEVARECGGFCGYWGVGT